MILLLMFMLVSARFHIDTSVMPMHVFMLVSSEKLA